MYDYYDEEDNAERREYEKKMQKGGKKYACPTCKKPNRLTLAEKQKHYQCDECADKAEAGYPGY